ncbi:MAG TPA: hypothetical protein VN635_10580 [Conexibacter sp.]|nr:hypothetical protein [Conexibacter sp.]
MPKTRAQRTWLIGACLGKVDVVLIIGLSTPHGQPAHALIHRLRYYSEEPPRGDLAKLIQLFGRDRSLRVAHPNGKRYGQADLVAGHPFLLSAHRVRAVVINPEYREPLRRAPRKDLPFDKAVEQVKSSPSPYGINREEPMI